MFEFMYRLFCCRWSLFIALLLLGVAVASEEEDEVPDAGVEGDEELALDQEVFSRLFI